MTKVELAPHVFTLKPKPSRNPPSRTLEMPSSKSKLRSNPAVTIVSFKSPLKSLTHAGYVGARDGSSDVDGINEADGF